MCQGVGHDFGWGAPVECFAWFVVVNVEVSQVLFRLSRWENLEHAKKNFDQDLKDRVVRLVEDRILAENMSMHPAC